MAFITSYRGYAPRAAQKKSFGGSVMKYGKQAYNVAKKYGPYAAPYLKKYGPSVLRTAVGLAKKFPRLNIRMRKRPTTLLLQNVPPSVGGAITYSSFRYKGNKLSRLLRAEKKLTTVQNYSTVVPHVLLGSTGKQFVISLYPMGHLFRNVLFNNCVNSTASTAIASTDQARKALLLRCWSKYLFTNYDISTCHLDIYICKPRENTVNLPHTLWQAAMPQTPVFGNTDESTAGAAEAWSIPYNSPFNCRSLCTSYKILKRIKVELQQGCTHSFSLSRNYNNVVTGRALVENGANYNPRYDIIPLFVVNGTPVHFGTGASTTVSTSKCQLDVVQIYGGSSCLIGVATAHVINTTSLPTISTETTLSVGSGTLVTD